MFWRFVAMIHIALAARAMRRVARDEKAEDFAPPVDDDGQPLTDLRGRSPVDIYKIKDGKYCQVWAKRPD